MMHFKLASFALLFFSHLHSSLCPQFTHSYGAKHYHVSSFRLLSVLESECFSDAATCLTQSLQAGIKNYEASSNDFFLEDVVSKACKCNYE